MKLYSALNGSDVELSQCKRVELRELGPSQYGSLRLKPWLVRFLTFSVVCNFVLFGSLAWMIHERTYHNSLKSPYAQLERNIPIPMAQETPYGQHDLTEVRRLWGETSIDAGMVAISDAYVMAHGLPTAQRYPWDESKGLYFLNGYHNLHCLRAISIALMEFSSGEPQSRRFHHVLHCVEALRQDIMCNADDTPRYTTSDAVPESGVGQVRMCRDWRKLEDWAHKHSACYRFINQTATGFPNVLRYTFCPPNSPDLAEVERVMGGSNLTDMPEIGRSLR